MIIKLIVVQEPVSGACPRWVVGAWDEYTIDENPSGFEEALMDVRALRGAENVRILSVRIPEGSLDKAFEVQEVEGLIEE